MAWNDEELYNNLTNAIGADRSMAPVLPEPQPLPEPSLWDQFQQTSGEDLFHSFVNGALIQPGRGILGTLRAAAENVGAQGAADTINSAINSETMQDFNVPNNVFSDLANVGGNVLGTVGLAMLPYVGTPAALGVAAANTFGNDYNDLRKANIDPAKAAGYSGADAAATAALEKVGLKNVLKGGGIGRSAVRGALSEGVTEGLQEFPNEIIPAYAKGEDIDIGKVAKNAVYAGTLAAPFGGLGGAAAGYINRRREDSSSDNNAIQDNAQQEIPNISSVDVESATNYLNNTAATMDASTDEEQAQLDRINDVLQNGSDEEKIQVAASLGEWEAPSQAPAMQMMSYLVNEKGYSPEAAAGIVGGFSVESGDGKLGINPGAVNESSGAYGIAQWLPDRKADLDKFAEERGLDPGDWQTQIQFVAHELEEGNETAARDGIMKAQNVDEAADLADELYERSEGTPEIRQRKRAAANAVLNAWNQVAPSYGSGSSVKSGSAVGNTQETSIPEETESVRAKGFNVSEDDSSKPSDQAEENAKEQEDIPETYSPDGEIAENQFDYIDDQGRPRSPKIDSYWKKINNTPTEELYNNHPNLVKRVDDAINNVGDARQWLHTTQLSGQTLRRLGKRIHEGKRINNNIDRVKRETEERKAVKKGAFEGLPYGNAQIAPQEQNVVDLEKRSPQLNITKPVSSGRERTSINPKESEADYYRKTNERAQVPLPENNITAQPLNAPNSVDFRGQVDLSTPSERAARIPEYGKTSLNDMFIGNNGNVIEEPGLSLSGTTSLSNLKLQNPASMMPDPVFSERYALTGAAVPDGNLSEDLAQILIHDQAVLFFQYITGRGLQQEETELFQESSPVQLLQRFPGQKMAEAAETETGRTEKLRAQVHIGKHPFRQRPLLRFRPKPDRLQQYQRIALRFIGQRKGKQLRRGFRTPRRSGLRLPGRLEQLRPVPGLPDFSVKSGHQLPAVPFHAPRRRHRHKEPGRLQQVIPVGQDEPAVCPLRGKVQRFGSPEIILRIFQDDQRKPAVLPDQLLLPVRVYQLHRTTSLSVLSIVSFSVSPTISSIPAYCFSVTVSACTSPSSGAAKRTFRMTAAAAAGVSTIFV